MPVRRIGLCYRSVGGRVPMGSGRRAVAIESTLERDFALLQRFDPEVASIEEQPVRIAYRGPGGERRTYVPDFLVTYAREVRPPLLVEVKYSTDAQLVSGSLAPRLAAATCLAEDRGWLFAVITEQAIRTPRLDNATFLLPFQSRGPDPLVRSHLVEALSEGCCSVAALITRLADCADAGRILPTLWGMVSSFELLADLDRPLTMHSLVQLPEVG